MNSTTNTHAPSRPDPILVLPRSITIRPYHLADAPSLSANLTTRVWSNLTDRVPHPYTVADAEAWASHCLSSSTHLASGTYDASSHTSSGELLPTNFAIVLAGEAVGSIGLEVGQNIYRRTATLGYWLGESHWGKGVMSLVVPAFVDWVWQRFERFVRLNATTYTRNEASGAVLRKAGFDFEGRRKKAYIKEGVVGDEDTWGALRPEQV
ncbi:hypothetical protein CAC42_6436 [Sphaceloma murrayae]|uniref:N-acetyltransferase domain-containing protein n=1 Tax=Sphaceloma murrayae TaxID=2082308 RepID=A0A2K1QN34_9PEZI|nr:hypothetical protein CAC42_6436 [Sphaceloma murrayae]